MADLQEKVDINAPIEDVFAAVADPENAADMFVNVDDVENLNDKTRETGAKYREYRQLSNRRVGTDIEISAFETEKLYEVIRHANGMHVVYRYEFRKSGENKTEISFEGTVNLERFLLKLARPLLVKMLRREDRDHLTKFKIYIEKKRTGAEQNT